MTASSPSEDDNWSPGGQLTPIEDEMLAAAATGTLAECAEGPFNLAAMENWGPDRTVRAEVLRHLLVVVDDWPVHAKGVQLGGVRISGQLDLEATTLRCPLRLERCHFPEPVNFDYASASLLSLTDCHLAGLRGNALVVTKDLDLTDSTFTSQLRLLGAHITGQLICTGAQLASLDPDVLSALLSLSGDPDGDILNISALMADNIRIGGDAFLDRVFATVGAVRLADADIGGQLNCGGAQLTGVDKDGDALIADNIRVGGGVFLTKKFTAAGAVRLSGADITGQLNCGGAQLSARTGGDGYALTAFRMKVGGDVILDEDALLAEKFTAAGAVSLTGANITGQLNCSGAQLTGVDRRGNALVADGVKVGDHVFLDKEFTAAGAVRLNGAVISGQLRCHGAKLSAGPGGDGSALSANGINVIGDVIFDEDFTAAGAISLRSARLDGSLTVMPLKLHAKALDAAGAHVTHKLRWEPREPVEGLVNLEDAVVGELQDSWTGPDRAERLNGFWPSAHGGKLRLDGFTYARIVGAQPAKLEQRLAWLGSQRKRAPDRAAERFATQPYEQLAQVYRQAGQDREAREVAIARRRDQRRYGDLSQAGQFGNWLLDFTIRYGYKTWRAVAGIILLYTGVLLFLWFARYHNAIIPVQTIAGLHPAPTATSCSSDYPCFNPFGYAIDTVIPLINVHQADFWGPNESVPWGTACVAVTYAGLGFGWALATLAVAGFTGLARKIDV